MSSQGHPLQSEDIEPFTLVNSLPGQVEVSSSHPINSPSGQVGVTPHKSEGIEPFTMVNSPPCQVGVTPRNPGGIEPLHLVNSLPGQVRLHPHTRSTLRRVVARSNPRFLPVFSPSLCSSSVAPVPSLMSSTSTCPITDQRFR